MFTDFGTEMMPLTMRNSETGRVLTASVYTLDGVDGVLSMGQLVLAICLSRAADIESGIVNLMTEIEQTSAKLNALTKIQAELVKWYDESAASATFDCQLKDESWTYKDENGKTYSCKNWRDFLITACGMTDEELTKSPLTRTEVETLINSISDAMDAGNSISQDQLLKLQSDTSKRDQAHDMVTNILKSFNTELVGNANNMR